MRFRIWGNGSGLRAARGLNREDLESVGRGKEGRMRAGTSLLVRVVRNALPALGLTTVLALRRTEAHSRRSVEAARTFVLSQQARRYLELQYRAYPTEFLGCMIGDQSGAALVVRRIAPADVDPPQSTRSHVLPQETCEASGWTGTIGLIHSHPGGVNCFYFFPGTRVPTSDAQSFALQPYPVDAIMCGDSIVWVNRGLVQRRLLLTDQLAAPAPPPVPGNRVHEGSRASLHRAS